MNYIQTCSNVLRHALVVPNATFFMHLVLGLSMGNHMAYTMYMLGFASVGFSASYDIPLAIAVLTVRVMPVPFCVPFVGILFAIFRVKMCLSNLVASCCTSLGSGSYLQVQMLWKALRGRRALVSSRHVFLLCLSFLPVTHAVCLQCHGAATAFGCKGDAASCPFATGVAANAKAIVDAGTSVITVSKLLPLWVVRCISSSSLRVILALAKRSNRAGEEFDPMNKNVGDIMKAVQQGLYPKDDAVEHCMRMADAIRLIEVPDEKLRRMTAVKDEWRSGASDLRTMKVDCESRREDESNTSALLYILALLSMRICNASKTEDFSLAVDDDDSSSAGSRSRRITASLKRPTSEGQMARLVNMWILVCQATGVATCLTLSSFVDEVIYQPIADQVYVWQVGFEVAVAYLMKAEASGGV